MSSGVIRALSDMLPKRPTAAPPGDLYHVDGKPPPTRPQTAPLKKTAAVEHLKKRAESDPPGLKLAWLESKK